MPIYLISIIVILPSADLVATTFYVNNQPGGMKLASPPQIPSPGMYYWKIVWT